MEIDQNVAIVTEQRGTLIDGFVEGRMDYTEAGSTRFESIQILLMDIASFSSECILRRDSLKQARVHEMAPKYMQTL